MIDAKDVMRLRTATGAGVNDCKKALTDAEGDFEKAIDLLRKQGQKIAAKKADRATSAGLIITYLHPNADTAKVGVMVNFACETDFVARNPDFQAFAKQIAMHIAAKSPQYVSRDQVPDAVVAKEKEIFAEQVKDKPAPAIEKIVAGKLDKFYAEVCLLDQPFVMDGDKSVAQMLTEKIATIGENMKIVEFARFEVGS